MSWPCLSVMAVRRHVPSVPAGTGSPLACVTMSLSVASGLLSPAGGSLVAGSYLQSCPEPGVGFTRSRCLGHLRCIFVKGGTLVGSTEPGACCQVAPRGAVPLALGVLPWSWVVQNV